MEYPTFLEEEEPNVKVIAPSLHPYPALFKDLYPMMQSHVPHTISPLLNLGLLGFKHRLAPSQARVFVSWQTDKDGQYY